MYTKYQRVSIFVSEVKIIIASFHAQLKLPDASCTSFYNCHSQQRHSPL